MKEKRMSTFKALKLTIVLLVLLLPWMQTIAFPSDTSDDYLSANDDTVIAMDLFNEPHPTPATYVENPFTEARGYINPDYNAKVLIEAQNTGGSLGAGMAKVADYSTAVQPYMSMLWGTTASVNSIDCFITYTANYTPVDEVYLPNTELNIGGQPVKASDFHEWNPYFDEKEYAAALRTAFVNAGMSSGIDISRSDWGGPDRPDSVSSSTDLNTYTVPHAGGGKCQPAADRQLIYGSGLPVL